MTVPIGAIKRLFPGEESSWDRVGFDPIKYLMMKTK